MDLSQFIEKQKEFAENILDLVTNKVDEKLADHKNRFKNEQLSDIITNHEYAIQMITKGISNNHPLAGIGISETEKMISNIEGATKQRYCNHVPDSMLNITNQLRKTLLQLQDLKTNNKLYKNADGRSYLHRLRTLLDELMKVAQEIDLDFNIHPNSSISEH